MIPQNNSLRASTKRFDVLIAEYKNTEKYVKCNNLYDSLIQ